MKRKHSFSWYPTNGKVYIYNLTAQDSALQYKTIPAVIEEKNVTVSGRPPNKLGRMLAEQFLIHAIASLVSLGVAPAV